MIKREDEYTKKEIEASARQASDSELDSNITTEEKCPVGQTPLQAIKINYQGKEIDANKAKEIVRGFTTLTVTMEEELDDIAKSNDRNITANDPTELSRNLKQAVARRLKITDDEQQALDRYQGGAYDGLNAALRGSGKAEKFGQVKLTKNLLSALSKLPKPKGTVYRTVSFKTAREYNDFVAALVNNPNRYVTPQFDSTKMLGGGSVNLVERPFVLQMRIEVDGEVGGDIASVIYTLPDREHEILFPPGTVYAIKGEPPTRADDTAHRVEAQVTLRVIGLDEKAQNAAMPTKEELSADLFRGSSVGKSSSSSARKERKGSF